jgi:hypothetical protein
MDDFVEYDATVTVTFRFKLEAQDDYAAERNAAIEWQNNLYHSEIEDIWVEMVEQDDSDEAVGGDEEDE